MKLRKIDNCLELTHLKQKLLVCQLRGHLFMNKLEEHLCQLVAEACKHQAGSVERQRSLTRLIKLIVNKLYKQNSPYYEDALQQTWVYFCQNICEGDTAHPYDSTRSSIVTWLNAYLKRRLQDFYIDSQKQQARIFSIPYQGYGWRGIKENIHPVDILAANPDVPPLLEEVRKWANKDPQGELSSIHVENSLEITCQTLILRRLPPETSWKTLAIEFNLPISTLSSFYQRQCIPRLRKFGESGGYL